MSSEFSDEVECITSLYGEDNVCLKKEKRNFFLSIEDIIPEVNSENEQFCKISLKFQITKKWPNKIESVIITKRRGIDDRESDEIITHIMNEINEYYKNESDYPIMEVLENLKEFLTNTINKVERKTCPICMEKISNSKNVKKFKCFHTFHSSCIHKWYNGKFLAKRYFMQLQKEYDIKKAIMDENSFEKFLRLFTKQYKFHCPVCKIALHKSEINGFSIKDGLRKRMLKKAKLYEIQYDVVIVKKFNKKKKKKGKKK